MFSLPRRNVGGRHSLATPATAPQWKHEIRNPKSETNSKFKFLKHVLSFNYFDFNIVSNFDIRISNFQCEALAGLGFCRFARRY